MTHHSSLSEANTTTMTAEILLSLPDASAAQSNRDLMQEFERALQQNPAANLIALIPDSYWRKHEKAQLRNLGTYAAKLNQRTINELQDILREDPEANLLSAFPQNYARRLRIATQSSTKSPEPKEIEKRSPPDFRTRLDVADTATIVFPLSDNVTTLLTHFSEPSDSSMDPEKSLLYP